MNVKLKWDLQYTTATNLNWNLHLGGRGGRGKCRGQTIKGGVWCLKNYNCVCEHVCPKAQGDSQGMTLAYLLLVIFGWPTAIDLQPKLYGSSQFISKYFLLSKYSFRLLDFLPHFLKYCSCKYHLVYMFRKRKVENFSVCTYSASCSSQEKEWFSYQMYTHHSSAFWIHRDAQKGSSSMPI